MLEMLVAAVSVELERCENRVKLPSELLCAETDEWEVDDFDRREPLMDPPKMSPRPVPGKALKMLREIASSPKIAARERLMVGVEGMEFFPVRNLNRPYWWTIAVRFAGEIPGLGILTRVNYSVRHPVSLYNVFLAFVTGVTRSDFVAGQCPRHGLNPD